MMDEDDVPILEYDEDSVLFGFELPADRLNFIKQWIKDSKIEGFMFGSVFFFKNKEDRNLTKLMI